MGFFGGMKTVAASLFALALAGQAAPASAEEPPYKIGAILSMSGAAPHYGTVMSRGALTAIDEINADGGVNGRKLVLVIEDHKSGDTQAAVAGMNRLITVEGTEMVLSSFSGPTVAIAPISKEKGILVLNGGGVSPRMVGVSPHMFHNRSLAADLGVAAVHRAKELGYNRIAQIAGKSEFGDAVIAASNEAAKQLGMEVVVVEQFATDATNIDTQVAKLRAAKPDVVLSWPTTPQSGLVVKRVRELGMTQPVLAMEWTAEDTKVAGNDKLENLEIVTDYFAVTDDNPMGKRFYDDYKAAYGEEPDFYAANYYEAVYVIAELLRRTEARGADATKGAELTASLLENPEFDSVYGGKMRFKENGVAMKRVAILKVLDEGFELVKFMPVREE